MTSLHSAITLGNGAPVRTLLRHGADMNVENGWGWAPLMSAVITGNENVVTILVEDGANLNASGSTTCMRGALHYAAPLGYGDVVEIMMKAGCDMGKLDAFRLNAAQCAAVEGHEGVVRRMLELESFEKIRVDSPMRANSARATGLTKIFHRMLAAFEGDSCRACVARTSGSWWEGLDLKLI